MSRQFDGKRVRAARIAVGSGSSMALASESSTANFAYNLVRLCKREASIAAVCRATKINRQQFNRYLAGRAFPNAANRVKICRYFNMSESELFRPPAAARSRTRYAPEPEPAWAAVVACARSGRFSGCSTPIPAIHRAGNLCGALFAIAGARERRPIDDHRAQRRQPDDLPARDRTDRAPRVLVGAVPGRSSRRRDRTRPLALFRRPQRERRA